MKRQVFLSTAGAGAGAWDSLEREGAGGIGEPGWHPALGGSDSQPLLPRSFTYLQPVIGTVLDTEVT